MISLLLALVMFDTRNELVFEVDRIEINEKYHPGTKKLEYVQVIIWNWDSEFRRFLVVDWNLVKDLNQYPMKNGKLWEYHKYDDRKNLAYTFTSKILKKTRAYVDPERENKKLFDEKYREVGYSRYYNHILNRKKKNAKNLEQYLRKLDNLPDPFGKKK